MKVTHTLRRGPVLIAALGLTLGLVGGGFVASTAIAGPSDNVPPGGSGKFNKNAKGQTYGSMTDAISPDQEPDLIKAVATNGQVGYLLKADVDKDVPKSMAEAAQFDREKRQLRDRTLNVYDESGTKVIGVFVIRGAKPSAAASSVPPE